MRAEYFRSLILLISVLAGFGCSAQTNGIFADFTTSLGTFTCQLSYSNAPKAVANFIGLATGEKPWLDLATGRVRTNAFYEGLTFHRVVSNFVNQAGSPNGLGTDGPGYAFVDEFNPLLNFNTAWILGMANSGPDSNGSQFFITVAPFTSGNNVYTVFGRAVSGTNVLMAINRVPTDSNNKPKTSVYIQQVTIRRVGAAAEAFDINAQGLPTVASLPVSIQPGSGMVSLSFSNRPYADTRWFSSTNLSSWTANDFGIEIANPSSNTVSVATDTPAKFFEAAQIQYPSSTFAPKNVLGRKLIMAFSGGLGTNTIVFDNSGGGTYNLVASPSDSGTLVSYSWLQQPYNGWLEPIQYSGLYEMDIDLNFSTRTNGTFTGTMYAFLPTAISGTFKLSP